MFKQEGGLTTSLFLVKFETMLILPLDTAQAIRFRARPHESIGSYFLVAWTSSEKVYGLIRTLTYTDGHIEGNVAFPFAVGLANGAKMNFRAFPIKDVTELRVEMLASTDADPFNLPIQTINAFLIAQITASVILKEVYRGQVFVSTKTQQPYNVT